MARENRRAELLESVSQPKHDTFHNRHTDAIVVSVIIAAVIDSGSLKVGTWKTRDKNARMENLMSARPML